MKSRIKVKGLSKLKKSLDPKTVVNNALKNKVDLTCPSCKRELKASPGLNECPYCHQKINVSVDIHH